jgi:hypothetical protein
MDLMDTINGSKKIITNKHEAMQHFQKRDFENNVFKNISFSGVLLLGNDYLDGLTFVGCSFEKISVSGARVRRLSFEDCEIKDLVFIDSLVSSLTMVRTNVDHITTHSVLSYDITLTDTHVKSLEMYGSYTNSPYMDGFTVEKTHFEDTNIQPVCPEEGSFIAWKKGDRNTLIKLLIPSDAKRSSGFSRHCRASHAYVMQILDRNREPITEAYGYFRKNFKYTLGQIVYADDWDEDRWEECSHGIHFFMTRKEAEDVYS